MPGLMARFAQALLDPAQPPPPGLHAPAGTASLAERLAVHRNTVLVSLVGVLAESFPVLRELLGAECFDAMAAAHVRGAPPRSPVMAHYGAGLPGWLEGFEPLAGLPWLADVARLEFARQVAAGAADAPALSAASWEAGLAAADPEALAAATLRLHPSVQRLRLRHAGVSLWHAHQRPESEGESDRDARLAGIDPFEPEQALVLRDPDDEVLVLPLTAAAATLVDALAEGLPLGEAAAGPGAAVFTPLMALLLRHGAVAGLATAPGAASTQVPG